MKEAQSKKLCYTDCWFAYFDLLGFSNLVRQIRQDVQDELDMQIRLEDVLEIYEKALGKLEKNQQQGISYSWFSDTFIIFSIGNSDLEFASIEHVSRLFFQDLVLRKIPVRGSLTIGPLYTDQEKNIFFGEALIDAYKYGEAQKWIGFILTPKVYSHFKGTELCLEDRTFYRPVDQRIFKKKKEEKEKYLETDNVYAFMFDNGAVNGKNPYLRAISDMKQNSAENFAEKYENTEEFIKKHKFLR